MEVDVPFAVRAQILQLFRKNLLSCQREDVQELIFFHFQRDHVTVHVKYLLAGVMHAIADIKHDLPNLTAVTVEVVDEENVLVVDVILSEVVNLSVEKVPVA